MSLLGLVLAALTAQTLAAPPTNSAKPKGGEIAIISQISEVSPDGTFFTQYETANGIRYQESGILKNIDQEDEAASVEGFASWQDLDGTPIRLEWQADENGVVFKGKHIPPVPILIQRALDWSAAHPYKEDKKQT